MAKHRNCAIYTRKSTEEGLEQDFNSLDAQREACSAFILSQRHEGWCELPDHYDDGGFSGGSMERPALEKMLRDIEKGRIDVVVVYKVDRLTRSLADFARIVQIFDGAGVSFVSVTQQFNTTTSMGRLTLNVLLSFAQFEREVTAERIRDKIAASKAKGMWMGGVPPIGYRAEDRKLVVDPVQAETVRHIFTRYLELGSVRRLQAELDMRGIRTPQRISRAGRRSGGCAFSKGKLYTMLSNPVYIGKTRHRAKIYAGQHEAIVDQATWDRVQALLSANRVSHKSRSSAAQPSPLAGKLFDPAGDRMRPVHTRKNDRRYRYYVSPRLIDGSAETGASGWRIPAEEVEARLAHAICERLANPEKRSGLFESLSSQHQIDRISDAIKLMVDVLQDAQSRNGREHLMKIIRRIDLREDRLSARIDLKRALEDCLGEKVVDIPEIEITAPIRIARRGAELKLVLKGAAAETFLPDPNLVQCVLDARRRLTAYTNNRKSTTLSQIAAAEGEDTADVSRSLQLAFLAPDVVAAILDGRQPVHLTATRLQRLENLPLLWEDQRRLLA